MNKRILVIGASSAIATEVIDLLAIKFEVISGGRSNCDINIDVTKTFTVPDNIDTIINFAAFFKSETDDEIIEAQKINTQGLLNICFASKRTTAHIINISSIFATLDSTSLFYSFYGVTKRHGDELAELYCSKNEIPLTIIRPSQIYGDNNNFARHQPFFYDIIDKAQEGNDVILFGSNDAKRNYIHVADLAEIIQRTVEKKPIGVFDCVNPSDVSYSQIAKAAQNIFDCGGEVRFLKEREDTPDNIFPQSTDLFEKIDFYPVISLNEGLNRIKNFRDKGR